MSSPGPLGGFGFDPNQLARLLSSEGPVNWELARMVSSQMAAGGFVSAEGEQQPPTSPNVDPLRRIRLEELARVAELHVGQTTGLSTSTTGQPLSVKAVTPVQWAEQTLDDYKRLIEGLAGALAPAATGPSDADAAAADLPPGMAGLAPLFAELPKLLAPMLMGMQSGMVVGQLALTAFGAYELPVPRPRRDELLIVSPTLDAFGEDWSLPPDDVGLWAAVREITYHSVLGVEHVRTALDDVLHRYVSMFRPSEGDLTERLGDLDPTNIEALQSALADPELVLGAIESDEQQALKPRLNGLVAVIEGYVAHVTDTVCGNLVTSYPSLVEAARRRQYADRDSDPFVKGLLGLERSEVNDRTGRNFIRGVLERAGDEGLNRLWESQATLPTPAEVEAPGLWLARLESM